MAKKQLTRTLDTSTAEGQEQALLLLQQASQLKTATVAPVLPIVKTIVEPTIDIATPPQYKAPKTVKTKTSIVKQGRPAKGAVNEGSSVKIVADGSSVKRINMDFPLDLYERIESEIDDSGQTVKGFFLMLAKQYFKNKGNTPSV